MQSKIRERINGKKILRTRKQIANVFKARIDGTTDVNLLLQTDIQVSLCNYLRKEFPKATIHSVAIREVDSQGILPDVRIVVEGISKWAAGCLDTKVFEFGVGINNAAPLVALNWDAKFACFNWYGVSESYNRKERPIVPLKEWYEPGGEL